MNGDPALSGLDLIRGLAAGAPPRPVGKDRTIPFTLICGYLGSGKTTFLNRLLTGVDTGRIAVLVNDFGAINIDAQLIRRRTEFVIELENGCACCSLAAGLTQTLRDLIGAAQPPTAIYMEASGLAEPNGILLTALAGGGLHLEIVLCLADAENLAKCADYPASAATLTRQIASADVVVLNKMDVATGSAVSAARAYIRSVREDARIFETQFAEVPAELLVTSAARPAPPVGAATHLPVFQAWHIDSDKCLDPVRFAQFMARIPNSIYRVKGFIRIAGPSRDRWLLQMVGRRWSLEPLPDDGDSGSHVVLIGHASPAEVATLNARLLACAA